MREKLEDVSAIIILFLRLQASKLRGRWGHLIIIILFLWFASPFFTECYCFFLWLPMISYCAHVFVWFSHAFLWSSCGFPKDCSSFPMYGCGFSWFSYYFPMASHWFPIVSVYSLLEFSYCIPTVFLWFSFGFLCNCMDLLSSKWFLWFSSRARP